MGLKLLTRLRLGLSHFIEFIEHSFNLSFKFVLTLYVVVALQLNQSHSFILLHCHHFSNIRSTHLSSINEVLDSITNLRGLSDCALVKILLFGDQNYTQEENAYIINATIKRFSSPLL